MTRQPDRPWWASEGPVDGGIDRSEDPVVRHRSARLGPRPGDDDLRGQDPDHTAVDEGPPSVASRRFGGNGQRASTVRTDEGADATRADRSGQIPVDGAHDAENWTLPVTSDDPEPGAGAPGAGAHTARRSTQEAPPDGSHRAGSPATDPSEPDRSGPPAHRPDLCGVCPICAGFRVLEDLRPELAGHLAEAAYHLAAALRSLAEHPPSPRGEASGRSEPTTMQHIDVE